MEHEVFVPVSTETLRQTLRDSVRVARCVPGLQQDADESAGPLSGRLKIRIGGHTITYRGTLRFDERDGVFTAEGEGTEARGTGFAKLTLSVRLSGTEGGTTLSFTGAAQAEGRLVELPAADTTAATHRLLDRFAARLAEESAPPASAESGSPSERGSGRFRAPGPGRECWPGRRRCRRRERKRAGGDPDASIFDADPESHPLDGETTSVEGDFIIPDEPPDLPDEEPPAEAAHARRSMIGRSAEEVDHAPPRGRYAPVPVPEVAGAGVTLRWIAPAAALALASAVVVGRALRRRR